MLTGRIRVQLITFVVIALVAATYLGSKYMGIDPLGSGKYRVTVALPEGGGIFSNGEVTYRGVPVGRIGEIRPTADGMEAVLEIDGDAPPIPADVTVSVNNRSAIGEQYVDLRGSSTDGPTLAAGDRLVGTEDDLPPRIDELLRTGRDFVASVPSDALNTVIDETYALSQGANQPLSRLLETSLAFNETAEANFDVTRNLIEKSATVLATQQESAGSIRGFSRDLKLLSQTMRDNDQQLRRLITSTPAAARQLHLLFDQVGAPLGTLMSNLISTAQVFGTNAAGVEDALIRVPEAVSIGWAVTGSQGMELGLAPTFFDPLPCVDGYQNTPLRPGLDLTPGKPFNIGAGCTLAPSSGTNVRGPKAVPTRKGKAKNTRERVSDATSDLGRGGS